MLHDYICNMKRRLLVFGFFIGMSLFACKDAQEVQTQEQGMLVKILHSSGDDFSYTEGGETIYFSGYPFNYGQVVHQNETYDVLVLSRRITSGNYESVLPIARMQANEPKQGKSKVVIAIPVDESKRICNATDFIGFMIEQYSFKHIVEYWYSNRFGLQGSQVESWQATDLGYFSNAN